MTAQAGAVAWRAVATEDGSSPQIVWIAMPVSSWATHDAANGICTIEYAYPTPPAAVPVEALEGLVAKWAEAASRMLDDAESMRDDDPRAARLLTSMAEQQVRDADELTQLIKERSNG